MTTDDADYNAPLPVSATAHHGLDLPAMSRRDDYIARGWWNAKVGAVLVLVQFTGLIALRDTEWLWLAPSLLSLAAGYFSGRTIGLGLAWKCRPLFVAGLIEVTVASAGAFLLRMAQVWGWY